MSRHISSSSLAGVRRIVPTQYATIQGAIDASIDGDTVLVLDGTYYKNIRFRGKRIVVGSTYLTTGDTSHISNTIIDGSNSTHPDSGSVVSFVDGEDTTSVRCGLTIRGGTGTRLQWGSYTYRQGGGVLVYLSSARLTLPSAATSYSSMLPYLASSAGSLALDFRPGPGGATASVSLAYTGSMRIQWFTESTVVIPYTYSEPLPSAVINQSISTQTQPSFVGTPSFWAINLRVDFPFRNGIAVYAGVDNITDYVRGDLGDHVFDYKWGPLRGRYVYGGLGYRFGI